MLNRKTDEIAAWLVKRGLAGASETELLQGFCEASQEAGLALSRAVVIVDTLHPIYEGRVFRWRGDKLQQEPMVEYGRTAESSAQAASWQQSPFHFLAVSAGDEFRRELKEDATLDFPVLATLRGEGERDYLAFLHRFASESTIGEMDCVYSSWTTRRASGFQEEEAAALRRLVPCLALAIKCASLARIARTLVEVYLGQDAGQRVLSGRISRGVAERIGAVLWFSDLKGYTAISDSAAPDEIIPLLNDYAEVVISAVQEAGGEVLKLVGDGTLAIFRAEEPAAACRSALAAEARLRPKLAALNERRRAEGRPATSLYLGLHRGEVFYGNIGSEDRLDFTVVGPAVNEVSRIAALCSSVDRHLVISSDFVSACAEAERRCLVSVGRFALRGVGRAQELFTLDPALL